ncbi:MAG: prephenate dehydrogenase/arogenate dehydrogenase family protein [Acidimicrobiia bacterium]
MTFPSETPRRAGVVGLGLIGGSIGYALRRRGWFVSGHDLDHARVDRAVSMGVIDAAGLDASAEVTFIATPVLHVEKAAREALAATSGIVTDVGSAKTAIVAAIDDPRFVGGHPMAGSEHEGLDGADADLFEGAVWVLTPTATNERAAVAVSSVVTSLGAEAIAIPAERHDALVAIVSHVPHLTAATLMTLAGGRAEEHAALLRLAAGGFRDMTRIASGHPAIWPDICVANRAAILDGLDSLIAGLAAMRARVDRGDREELLDVLTRARAARRNLPSRVSRPEELAEVRIPISDRPGEIAEVTTLAAEIGVNIADIEVAHSAEGDRGVLIVLVESAKTDLFRGGLLARGYRPAVQRLS